MAAAASAVNPIAAPPQPGTAVKDPARSIVSRMKRRLSAARSSRGTRTGRGDRAGSAGAIDLRGYAQVEGCQVLCTTESRPAVNRSWVSSHTARRGEQNDNGKGRAYRSEEHTSELQSPMY